MSRAQPVSRVDPATLPHVWRVGDLAPAKACVSTGYEALDAQLPGGGWPTGSVIEILQEAPSRHVWRLVLPGLVSIMSRQPGPAVLIGAPLQPFAPSLAAQGLNPERLLCVQSEKTALRLWAAEQALRCAQVTAVMAWLPQARSEELRRLQLAAQQHGRMLFVFRDLTDREQASPAALRIQVGGIDRIEVEIVKRRGPPLIAAISLPATSPRLASLLNARRGKRFPSVSNTVESAVGISHVLDRTAAVQ
jgi:protein ImuA